MFIIAALIIRILCDGCPVVAQSPSEEAGFLLSGLRAERDKLQTGRYRASGRRTLNEGGGILQLEWEIHGAFDRKINALRLDRKGQVPVGIPPAQRIPNGPTKELISDDIRLVVTPDKVISWTERQRVILIAPGGSEFPYGLRPLLIETLGASTSGALTRGMDLSAVIASCAKNATKVIREAGAPTQIVSTRPESEFSRILWIDERRGYSPIRSEFHALPLNAPRQVPFPDPKQPEEDIHVSWANRGGTWVPTSFKILASREWQFTIDWVSVNEPLSPELFEPEGMELPLDTEIQDSRR